MIKGIKKQHKIIYNYLRNDNFSKKWDISYCLSAGGEFGGSQGFLGKRTGDRSSRTEYRVGSYEYNRTFKGYALSVIVTQPKSSDE